jgi:hypothetical protein
VTPAGWSASQAAWSRAADARAGRHDWPPVENGEALIELLTDLHEVEQRRVLLIGTDYRASESPHERMGSLTNVTG